MIDKLEKDLKITKEKLKEFRKENKNIISFSMLNTIETCFRQYKFQYVDKVYFHIGAFNIRSQKAIEKIGAIKVDEFEVEYYGEDSKLNFVYLIEKK